MPKDYQTSLDTLLSASVSKEIAEFISQIISCENEIKDGITATFDPMPQADQQPDNSVYNLNALLDLD